MITSVFRSLSIGDDVHFVSHNFPVFMVTNVWIQTQGDENVFFAVLDDGKDKTVVNDTEDVVGILELDAPVAPSSLDTSDFETQPVQAISN
jgi:hypothetical protein